MKKIDRVKLVDEPAPETPDDDDDDGKVITPEEEGRLLNAALGDDEEDEEEDDDDPVRNEGNDLHPELKLQRKLLEVLEQTGLHITQLLNREDFAKRERAIQTVRKLVGASRNSIKSLVGDLLVLAANGPKPFLQHKSIVGSGSMNVTDKKGQVFAKRGGKRKRQVFGTYF